MFSPSASRNTKKIALRQTAKQNKDSDQVFAQKLGLIMDAYGFLVGWCFMEIFQTFPSGVPKMFSEKRTAKPAAACLTEEH
jgi:hypothetical protein